MGAHHHEKSMRTKEPEFKGEKKAPVRAEDNLELVEMPQRILDQVAAILRRNGIYATGRR